MAYDKTNVLVGPATIFCDETNMGWTSGGVTIEHSSEFYNVEVDQAQFPVKSFRTKESFKIKTNLVENTLENIKIAWGIDAAIDLTTTPGYRRLVIGGSASEAPEHTLDVYGNAPGIPGGTRQRRLHFYRVVSIEFGSLVVEKNKEQVIPVTFEALLDSTYDAIGYVEDQTIREFKKLTCKVTVA
jgi:hypothetical protein